MSGGGGGGEKPPPTPPPAQSLGTDSGGRKHESCPPDGKPSYYIMISTADLRNQTHNLPFHHFITLTLNLAHQPRPLGHRIKHYLNLKVPDASHITATLRCKSYL